MANKRKKTGKERRKKRLQNSQKPDNRQKSLKMSPAEATLINSGMNTQVEGNLDKAEEIYRTVLNTNPDNALALLQIGTIYYSRNDLHTAESYMKEAYSRGLQDESYYINYGLVCEKLSRNAEAEEAYRKAVKLNPGAHQVYYNMGILFYKQFRFEEAIQAFDRANTLNPGSWATEFQLACSLQECKRYKESLPYFYAAQEKQPQNAKIICGIGMSLLRLYKPREALNYVSESVKLAPNNPIILYNYAFVLKENGEKLKARKIFEESLRIDPRCIESLLGLGRLLTELGDYDSCREYFNKAIELKPDYYAPYASMGISYYKTSAKDAVKWFDKALAINPKADDVYSLRGYALNILGMSEEAEKSLRKAVELNPEHAEYHQNLGNVLVVQGKVADALHHCKISIELNPHNNLAFSNALLYMHYIPQSTREDIWQLHQTYSNLFEPKELELKPYLSEISKERKIRIGLVSSDLRKHSVAYFVEPLLANKNSDRFEYYAYANVKVPDAISQHIANLSDKWQSILQLSDVEAAELIRQDKIDILIDLGGHTADNRLRIFTLKPAPVQVSWLGYPDTTGLKSIDYRLVDEITDPEGSEKFSSEILVRLPGGFHCYSPFRDSPEIGEIPSRENGFITFGSFNNFAKCSDETIFLWSEILKNTPGSRMILKALSLGDKSTQEYAYERFNAFGIERERVIMLPRTKTLREHFSNYNKIDVALDTYPYNGTTTTCEALWMGVPVVSFFGPNHASRVGLSLLTHTGLRELAAGSPEEYVNKAVSLAQEEEIRINLRKDMRERLMRSPIIHAPHFAKKFEETMLLFWNTYCDNPTGRHETQTEKQNFTFKFSNEGETAEASEELKLNFSAADSSPDSGIRLNFSDSPVSEKSPDKPEEGFRLKF